MVDKQAAADPSEVRRTERWLATARVFLAVSALVAIRMDPTQLGNSPAAYGLLGFYMGNSILVLMLLRRRKESTASFRLLVHAADIVWPAFISVFRRRSEKPLHPVFCFRSDCCGLPLGLVGDAEHGRGGSGLAVGGELCAVPCVGDARGSLPWHIFSGLRMNTTEFEPKRLFMLSVYLLVMGLLLGYLAEQQKHLRAEKAASNPHAGQGAGGRRADRNAAADQP